MESESDSSRRTWGRTVNESESESHSQAQSHVATDSKGTSYGSSWQRTHSAFLQQGISGRLGAGAGIEDVSIGLGAGGSKSVTELQGVSWGEQAGVSEQHSDFHGTIESEVQSRGRSVSQSEGGFQSHTVIHGQSGADSEADGIQYETLDGHPALTLQRGAVANASEMVHLWAMGGAAREEAEIALDEAVLLLEGER